MRKLSKKTNKKYTFFTPKILHFTAIYQAKNHITNSAEAYSH
jgi:hypothetical protein